MKPSPKPSPVPSGLQLSSGDRVCIVGGGPAGSFAALHLLDLAQKRGIELEVVIFESRRFSAVGPGSCKGCAGILSSRLLTELENLGLTLPEEVVQSELHSYAAHVDGDTVYINKPDPNRRIVSVYRGSGPKHSSIGPGCSFDRFLIDQACARGAQHVAAYVRKVRAGERPVVCTGQQEWEADLLVIASGINVRSPLAPEFGYSSPKIQNMAQDEILRPSTWPENQVSVFFRQPPGLIFGAIVPKGQYLNISLLGMNMNRRTISSFIEAHGLDLNTLELPDGLCGCMPRLAVSAAQNYYGDRWVTVGDAAVTRLYKDGIGSACFTAQAAMQTAIYQGISENAFRRHYASKLRTIVWDNYYGQLLLWLWGFTLSTPPLLKAWKKAVLREANWPAEKQIHSRILWGVFTGDELYRDLFRLILRFSTLESFFKG